MAIVFDAAGTTGFSVGTSRTVAHTCTGSDGLLMVVAQVTGAALTGITYNGVSMTSLTTSTVGAYTCYCYYLAGPATGSNNIVISCSSSQTIISSAASYTGAAQTSTFTDSSSNTSTATSFSITNTSTEDNSWHTASWTNASTPTALSVGSGTTARTTIGGSLDFCGFMDNNADITPAGSNTLNFSSSGSQAVALLGGTFSPVGGAPAAVDNAVLFACNF